jgi:AcrR family transcriptional regulator
MFAEKGLDGARVDEIAEATNTSKRMIYYYFGSKDGLFEAVLARAYLGIRRVEESIAASTLTPSENLRRIVRETVDYQAAHPTFVRLVSIENIHHARFLKQIEGIREHNRPIIASLAKILDEGVQSGVFRPGINPVDLHWLISACAVFNISNDATFSYLFESKRSAKAKHAGRRTVAEDAVLRYCEAS